jgi:hypothetical protein
MYNSSKGGKMVSLRPSWNIEPVVKTLVMSQVPMTHSYNPSYLGRDQKDFGLRPAQANSLGYPILKKTHHKKGLV